MRTRTPRVLGLAALLVPLAAVHSTHAAADEAALTLGKTVFMEQAQPGCGVCHTLADANAAGEIGPVLDEMKPDAERVRAAVMNGIGVMPAFEALTAEQVDAVARYVSEVAGRAR